MVAEEVFVNCANFNPIKSKMVIFKVTYPEPELEPEPQFGFAAPWTRSRKKKFSAPQHC